MNDRKYILWKPVFWMQVIVWVALFFMPFTFVRPNQSVDIKTYFLLATQPLAMMMLFYLNYCYLLKKFFEGKRKTFWIVNLLLVLVLSVGIHESMAMMWRSEQKKVNTPRMHEMADHKEQMPKHKARPFAFLLLLRESFSLSVVIGIAGAIAMWKRLSETEDARKEAENAKARAELCNLRSQINPHFLLNTLNNIYALTAFDANKAQCAIMELSKMLRHILYDNQQPFVKLTEEVVFLHNYIELMKIRLSKNVEVVEEINVPENCKAKVAPMIFISLIENAFKHGVSPTENSFIIIRIYVEEGKIICHIENSNFPKTESDRSGHGIGLQQVLRRLELTYSGKYEWIKGRIQDSNVYSSKIIIYDT